MANEGNYRHGLFCWHEIATRDPATAKKFYREAIGYDLEDTDMPGGGTYTMVRANGGDVAGLYEMTGEMFEGVPPHWMPYVWVDDVDATAAKAKELGGTVVAEPMDVPDVGKMAVLQDPTGATISVFHGTGHPGATRQFSQGVVGWNELMTSDAGSAEKFYKQLFGWSDQKQDMGDMVYTVFSSGDETVGGMMEMQGEQWQGIPPHWMPYVGVDDCHKAAVQVKATGGSVEVPPTDIPGVGTFSVVKDPTGAVFSIMKFTPREG